MAERPSYLIIGNGIAGVVAAETLRAEDSAAAITVVADDPFPVYYRPALKDYLGGRLREDKLWARPTAFYQNLDIRFIPARVVALDTSQRTVALSGGQRLGYSRALLAQGASATGLTCPGATLAGVARLRTVADYQEAMARLPNVRRVVVTGSGTLALETIETLRHRGVAVTHLVRRRALWSEALDATASDLVLAQERRDGVDVRLEEEIAEITGQQGQVTGIVTARGAQIACESVVCAIGIDPIIDFVKRAGVACGRGVTIDETTMRTNAPGVFAAGDVVETTDPLTKRARVLGQWYPAIQQARAAAYSMLDLLDTSRPFRGSVFYNATFLYGLPFASVGVVNIPRNATPQEAYTEIVADPQPRVYQKVIVKRGVPVGMLALGDRRRVLAVKRAIDHSVDLSPVLGRLFADEFNLTRWLDDQGIPPARLTARREGMVDVQAVAYTGGATVRVAKPAALATPAAGATPRAAPTPPDVAPAGPAVAPQTGCELTLVEAPGGDLSVAPQVTPLSQTRVMGVGRQDGGYLRIAHASISRRHAELSYANGQYLVRDLGSFNGTFINGARVPSGSVTVLPDEARIRFGDVVFQFVGRQATSASERTMLGLTLRAEDFATRRASAGPAPQPDQPAQPAPAAQPAQPAPAAPLAQPTVDADGSLHLPGANVALPPAAVAALATTAALVAIMGGEPRVYPLQPGATVTLGRAQNATIRIADTAVSRQHAEVFSGPDGFYIRDLGSSNGVIVNATRIANPYRLTSGDRITIANLVIYFLDQRDDARTRRV